MLRCGTLTDGGRRTAKQTSAASFLLPLPPPQPRCGPGHHGSASPEPLQNRWEFLGTPRAAAVSPPRRGCFFSQDALGLSAAALHLGLEGQDLGLPLLHVLGKKPGGPDLDLDSRKTSFFLGGVTRCSKCPWMGSFHGRGHRCQTGSPLPPGSWTKLHTKTWQPDLCVPHPFGPPWGGHTQAVSEAPPGRPIRRFGALF